MKLLADVKCVTLVCCLLSLLCFLWQIHTSSFQSGVCILPSCHPVCVQLMAGWCFNHTTVRHRPADLSAASCHAPPAGNTKVIFIAVCSSAAEQCTTSWLCNCHCKLLPCVWQTYAMARLAAGKAAAAMEPVPAVPAFLELTARCRICASTRHVGLESAVTEPAAVLKASQGTTARLKVSQ